MVRNLLVSVLFLALLCVPKSARAEPQRTTVGIYVNQVSSLDLKTNTFTVDFWLWFRSSGRTTAPLDSFEIIGARINARGNAVKKVLPDGQDYAAVRVNATIYRKWDLHRYPFDDHPLEIAVEDADLDAARSVFVADVTNQGMDPEVAVAGWSIDGFDHSLVEHVYPSSYGDTSIGTKADARFSRYVLRLQARRHGSARFLKIALPLFVSVLAAWCAFFIRPKDASPRVGVAVGALFAAAAGTVAINNQLPEIDYATMADRTVFLTFAMIGLSLIASVVVLGLHYAGREAAHRRVDRAGALLFPALFALLLVWVVR
ncbi:MAG TPA: hypothetical protein VLT33_01850 [Labilithrix sp.]|nr:hypothetical protein [Labilithrix sp.]